MLEEVNKVQLDIPALASAHAWDKRLNTLDDMTTTLEVLSGRLESPLHARRYLQAALTTRDPEFLRAALEQVQKYSHAGLEGITSKVMVQLGHYADVLSKDRALPVINDDWHLENMLDDEVGQASACVELGELQRAQAHLYGARLLAGLLKMPYQLQWCLLEGGRLGLVQGQPDSGMIREALSLIPPSARRAAWGKLTLAESLYSEGDGHAAWVVASEMDPATSEGFATLLGLYLGHEITEYELQGPGIYAAIARAMAAREDAGAITRLPIPDSQPAWGIVQALQVAVMASNAHHVSRATQQVELLLKGNSSPIQRVFLLALLLDLSMKTETADLHATLREFAHALESLSVQDYALDVLLRHAPHALALLAYSPYALPTIVAIENRLPLIVGQHLQVDGARHVLPGRSQGGVQLVRRGFFGKQVHLHHAARSRIYGAVRQYGHPMAANAGGLLLNMLHLARHAPPAQRDAWKEGAIRLLELIDSRALSTEITESEIYRDVMKM